MQYLREILMVGGRLLQQGKIQRSSLIIYGFIYILNKICFKITNQDIGDSVTSSEKCLAITLYKLTCNDNNYIIGEIMGYSELTVACITNEIFLQQIILVSSALFL